MIFQTCLNIVEFENVNQAAKSLEGFRRHMNVYFQLDVFVFLFLETRHHLSGELADRAWNEIAGVYQNHSELVTEQEKELYDAVKSSTLRFWNAHEAELTKPLRERPPVPEFIWILRGRGSNEVVNTPTSCPPPSQHLEYSDVSATGQHLVANHVQDGPNNPVQTYPVNPDLLSYNDDWNDPTLDTN